MPNPIGFIGLGNLGQPIAANLLEAGYRLTVYNRTSSKADALVARGAVIARRPADAVTAGGVVVTLLTDDAAVEEVVGGDGFLDRLGPGGVHLSMSTLSPDCSRRLASLHQRHGSVLVEAPVFGRPEAAVAKKLWVVCAGPGDAKQRARPIFDAMGAQGVFDFGEAAGAATTVKLIGNLLTISARSTLAEGLALARNNGLDAHAVVDMLSTLFPAPVYQSFGRALADGAATGAQTLNSAKDLNLYVEAAKAAASPADIAKLLSALHEAE